MSNAFRLVRRLRRLSGFVIVASAAVIGVAEAQPPDRVAPAAHVEVAANDADPFDQERLIRELMRRRGGDPAATAQLIQLTRPLEPAAAAAMFDELAEAHLAAGNLDLAAETRRALVAQYPDEPRAAQATLWLVRVYSSSEVAVAARRRSGFIGTPAELRDADQGLARYALSLTGGAADAAPDEPRRGDAALEYQRYVAARRAGLAKAADGLLTMLKRRRLGDAWGDGARAEAWLNGARHDACPKALAHCARAAAPPLLDGALDEPCWLGDGSLALGVGENQAVVRFAYDDAHLYLAAACPRAAGAAYPLDQRPRPRDGDLSGHDRVRLRLDADRDYATWFELTVDSRGWTGDRCWDDPAWDPEWYVAAAQQPAGGGGRWIVEAAIPWRELADRAPAAGEAWACSADRATPGADSQSWQGDLAEPPGPAQFGLLLFE